MTQINTNRPQAPRPIRAPTDEEVKHLLTVAVHNNGGPSRWIQHERRYVVDPFDGVKTYDVTVKLSNTHELTAAVVNGEIIVRDEVLDKYYFVAQAPVF